MCGSVCRAEAELGMGIGSCWLGESIWDEKRREEVPGLSPEDL